MKLSLRRTIVATAAGIALGCGGANTPAQTAAPEQAPALQAPGAKPAALSPLETQLRWAASTFNNPGKTCTMTEAEAKQHFSDDFLSKLPIAQIFAVCSQLAAQAPFEVGAVKLKDGDPNAGTLPLSKGGQALSLFIALEANSGRIAGMWIRPESNAKPIASWSEATSRLSQTSETTELFVANVNGETCQPILDTNPSARLAIGSTFKLYVLLALAEAVSSGKLSWSQTLAIQDSLKSLPSGTMQNLAAGTEVTLAKAATEMISVSDNTATDHLIHAVTTKAVEKALSLGKNSVKKRNVPFLSTRDMFMLKLVNTSDQRDAFLKMSEKKKRAWLLQNQKQSLPALESLDPWDVPRHVDSIEWFAGGMDLCNVMVALHARAKDKNSVLLDILGTSHGLPEQTKAFKQVAFKGGSEPGVMSMTWLLTKNDGTQVVLSIGANDTRKKINEDEIVAIAKGALTLISQGK